MNLKNFDLPKSKIKLSRNTSLIIGTLFFFLGIFDFCLNNFLGTNITSFLPRFINFFTPLIFGVIGLHFIRIEFSGIKILDSLNKNINPSNFNAALSLCIIFLIIFALPPLLNWFIFDANIAGDTKEACTTKINEEQLYYCNQRGLNQEEAVSLIVNGFCKEVLQQLPMEFAVEAQKLVAISLEGSVG